MTPLLSVRGLTRPGLPIIDFDLEAGECLAVRGASGTGKSLFLRALADLDPNQGEVRLDGEEREAMPAPLWRRRVAYLPAEPGWWAETVRPHMPDAAKAPPLMAALGLPEEALDWAVARLSTGERQRLGLIRVLLLEPRVYLLDEPTSGLDSEAVAAVEALMMGRLAAGASALWVTHDAAQAWRIARRALVFEAGGLREQPLRQGEAHEREGPA